MSGIETDIEYILLDFDHCLVKHLYNDVDKEKIEKTCITNYSFLMDKYYDNKMTFEESSKLLKMSEIELKELLDIMSKRYELNQKLLIDMKDEFEKIPIAIASNTSKYITSRYLKNIKLPFTIQNYFSPENVNWSIKPDMHFFLNISQQLGIKPNRILLIDDSKSNLEVFKKMGGYYYEVERTDMFGV